MQPTLIQEFLTFLKEYKIVSLAIAFVMGTASTALVNSLVKDIIMPFFNPFLAHGTWREAVLTMGPIHLAYGSFIAEMINFVIIALVIFIAAKKIFKEEKVSKK